MSSKRRLDRRGHTLIDLMLGVAIIGILGSVLIDAFGNYQRANSAFREDEAIGWVIDAELARAASCPDARCLRALSTKTATTANLSLEAASWGRASVYRRAEPLGNGLWRIDVRASLSHLRRPREASTIVRVRR